MDDTAIRYGDGLGPTVDLVVDLAGPQVDGGQRLLSDLAALLELVFLLWNPSEPATPSGAGPAGDDPPAARPPASVVRMLQRPPPVHDAGAEGERPDATIRRNTGVAGCSPRVTERPVPAEPSRARWLTDPLDVARRIVRSWTHAWLRVDRTFTLSPLLPAPWVRVHDACWPGAVVDAERRTVPWHLWPAPGQAALDGWRWLAVRDAVRLQVRPVPARAGRVRVLAEVRLDLYGPPPPQASAATVERAALHAAELNGLLDDVRRLFRVSRLVVHGGWPAVPSDGGDPVERTAARLAARARLLARWPDAMRRRRGAARLADLLDRLDAAAAGTAETARTLARSAIEALRA